jgi:hypothetical protein
MEYNPWALLFIPKCPECNRHIGAIVEPSDMRPAYSPDCNVVSV